MTGTDAFASVATKSAIESAGFRSRSESPTDLLRAKTFLLSARLSEGRYFLFLPAKPALTFPVLSPQYRSGTGIGTTRFRSGSESETGESTTGTGFGTETVGSGFRTRRDAAGFGSAFTWN